MVNPFKYRRRCFAAVRCARDGFDTKRDNCETACEISGRVCSASQSNDPTRDGYDFVDIAVTSFEVTDERLKMKPSSTYQ